MERIECYFCFSNAICCTKEIFTIRNTLVFKSNKILTEISRKLAGSFDWQQQNLSVHIVNARHIQTGQSNIKRIRLTIFVNAINENILNKYLEFRWKKIISYWTLFMTKSDGPYALMSLAVMRSPFDVELSDTNRSPRFNGSMLGMSISGMPRAK